MVELKRVELTKTISLVLLHRFWYFYFFNCPFQDTNSRSAVLNLRSTLSTPDILYLHICTTTPLVCAATSDFKQICVNDWSFVNAENPFFCVCVILGFACVFVCVCVCVCACLRCIDGSRRSPFLIEQLVVPRHHRCFYLSDAPMTDTFHPGSIWAAMQ